MTRYRKSGALLLSRRGFTAAGLAASVPAFAPRAFAAGRDRLVVAQGSDVLTLNPSADSSPISINVFHNIFDALADIAPDGKVVPRLATHWESSPDATVWTFTIRQNAKFHDGTLVTLDDVIFSYETVMSDTKSPVRIYLSSVKSIDKVGEDKVRFTLSAPFAPFDRQVSLISVFSRSTYQKVGAAEFSTHPIGSGPFKLVRWVKDDHIELTSFADYWGGAPRVPTLVFAAGSVESSRTEGLLSGDLDIVPVLPPSSIRRVSGASGIHVSPVTSNRIIYLGFNVDKPPMDQLKFRQAVDCAVDRGAITAKLLGGLGKPAGQIVAPVMFGYDPSITPTGYDANKARDLVKQSGYDGASIVLQYPTIPLCLRQ